MSHIVMSIVILSEMCVVSNVELWLCSVQNRCWPICNLVIEMCVFESCSNAFLSFVMLFLIQSILNTIINNNK